MVGTASPIWLTGSPATFVKSSSTTGAIFTPWHIFWFLGDTGHVVIGGDGLPKPAPKRVWEVGAGKWHVDAPVNLAGDRLLVPTSFQLLIAQGIRRVHADHWD